MKNNKIKAVVVGGWMHDGEPQMMTLIGAFENEAEAYGEAYLYLNELASHYGEEKVGISQTVELEGNTGYAMFVKNEEEKILDYAYILNNDDYKEQEERNAGNT